jgi:hypothetical protein
MGDGGAGDSRGRGRGLMGDGGEGGWRESWGWGSQENAGRWVLGVGGGAGGIVGGFVPAAVACCSAV